jgi:uncharacterized protein YukE
MNNLPAKLISAPMLWLVLLVAGCQTASIDDLGVSAPQPLTPTTTAVQPAPVPTTVQPTQTPPSSAAPTIAAHEAASANKLGNYPKIGNLQTGQTSQLSSADKSALRSDLSNSRRATQERSKGESVAKYQAELKKLRQQAKDHGKKSRNDDDNLSDAQKELIRLRIKLKNHGKDALKKIKQPSG